MRNLILFTLSTLAFLIHPLFLPAQNSFSFSIEANSAAGDQAVTSVNVSPDFDGDGMVGFSDFLAFVGLFGSRQGDGRYEAKYDLDSDGAIGFSDFLIFSASFGKEVSSPNVAIPDASLRAVIADSLGKASGAPITQAEMATLTRLDASNANISDLTGLEFAINLTELVLGGNEGSLWKVNINELFSNPSLYLTYIIEQWINFSFISSVNRISDVTPLSNLTRLRFLDLSHNSIANLTPLSNLTRLRFLGLSGNGIANMSALSGLTNLEVLILSGNSIANVTSISNLTNLRWLTLDDNNISDMIPISNLTRLVVLQLDDNSISNVTPISNLINLIDLDLASNSISDLAPLVANTGLGEGDEVDVSNNPLSATSINIHIPTLESRGVEVDFSASKPTVKNKELRMPFRMIEPFGMKKWKVGDNLRKGRLNDF